MWTADAIFGGGERRKYLSSKVCNQRNSAVISISRANPINSAAFLSVISCHRTFTTINDLYLLPSLELADQYPVSTRYYFELLSV
jgi:hypothetical protein